MNYDYTDGTLRVELPERIDPNNVEKVEKSLMDLPLKDADEILFDLGRLEYISSLGLRVLLKCRQRIKKTPMNIINASENIYEIMDTTGFTEIFHVTKKMRYVDVSAYQLLGRGMYGSVYRINSEQILKVYHGVQSGKEMLPVMNAIRAAFVHGLPTIIPFEVVRTEKGIGTILELVNAEMLSALIHDNPEKLDQYVAEMAELAKQIANEEFEEGSLRSRREMMNEKLDNADAYLDPEEIAVIHKYINAIPDRNTGVHGDFHARNLMMREGELLLIDMDEFSCGHPIWDISNIMYIYQGIPHEEPANGKEIFGVPAEAPFEAVYFEMIGATFEEADRIWKTFFETYFAGYPAEEKESILALSAFYCRFKFINYLIDSCNASLNDPKKLEMNIKHIRRILAELEEYDLDELMKALDLWE